MKGITSLIGALVFLLGVSVCLADPPEDCTPDCEAKECGDDGCGGSCGTCNDGEICVEGQCEIPCVPDCEGKACGDDGCGESCGTCEEPEVCVAGTCEPPPTCVQTGTIACGDLIEDSTTGLENNISEYGCTGWDETGPEAAYLFTPEVDDQVSLTLTYEGIDLDVFVLEALCTDASCVAYGNLAVELEVSAGTTYYIVVDGYGGDAGDFQLGLECLSACVPQCEGMECGEDGCGGSCWTSNEPECNDTGVCVNGTCIESDCEFEGYIPDCNDDCRNAGWLGDDICDAGFQCAEFNWDEGDCPNCDEACEDLECGEPAEGCLCGECEEGFSCEEGLCAACEPACEGKACGPDGCGGSCWTSNEPECNGTEVCVGGTCLPMAEDSCVGLCGVYDGEKDCQCDSTCVMFEDCCEDICDACLDMDLEGWCCYPDCTDKACGDDGCGGSCGLCQGAEICFDGQCCAADCDGKYCGDDGCGGSCGECPVNKDCIEGTCVGCEPDCDGKDCGDDGCGGSCWTSEEPECGGAEICIGGSCVENPCEDEGDVPDCDGVCNPQAWIGDGWCDDGSGTAFFFCEDWSWDAGDCGPPPCTPDCEGKDCGTDGCAGSCGTCNDGEDCVDGLCIVPCEPDCEDKDCGDDGCEGTCGECAEDEECVEGTCEVICIPDCEDKVCGTDGCEGTCGTCDDGETCVGGLCETDEPAEDTVQPAEDTVQPGEDTVQPSEDTVQPSEDTVQPSEDTVQPAEDTVDADSGSDDSGDGGCATGDKPATALPLLLALLGLAALRRRVFSL